jgi:hypothetical protein
MITLTILCILYTVFGLIILKRKYGSIETPHDAPLWVIAIAFTGAFSLVSIVFAIIKYLP